jgi:uncharacterized protein YgfB (UPF0149 family)
MRTTAASLALNVVGGSVIAMASVCTFAADLPETVTGTASSGLIQIATTGNPEGLHGELGGEVVESSIVASTVGDAVLNGLLDIAQDEHLAPMALVAPDNTIYAMVAPTITKDNFVMVSADGVARRMDVGNSEGDNMPFVVAEIDTNAQPEAVSGQASAGLIQLATTGNPEGLHAEMGGDITDSTVIADTVGAEALNALLDVAQDEHLAPKALVAPSGDIYAMVAPTITKDNFILVTGGEARRMDVGASEGTNVPFQVTKIVSDGGTPWYLEFWYWLTGA